jgi:hypothetical protein
MNRQLVRTKKRSDDTIVQVVESDDNNNVYVNVDAGTLDEVSNITSVDLIDEVNKSVTYATAVDTGTETSLKCSSGGNLFVRDIQSQSTILASSPTSYLFPNSAPAGFGHEIHVDKPSSSAVSRKHMVYINNPSIDTDLSLSIRNELDLGGSSHYAEIQTETVPKSSYTLFSATAWSSCFTSIGGVLSDESGDLNDANLAGDVPFTFGAVNDAIYFGHSTEFQRIRLNIATAGNYVATFVYEYWNGSAWTALTEINDMTAATTNKPFTITGWKAIDWYVPSDWTVYDIAGDPTGQYWMRIRCDSFTSLTTGPAISQGYYKDLASANSHGYLVENLFNGDDCKIVFTADSAVSATGEFYVDVVIKSV